MAQSKHKKHPKQKKHYLLCLLALSSAALNGVLCKQLVVERALAAEQHGAAVAYRNTLEGLVTTLHGKVRSAYICKLRPQFELTQEDQLFTSVAADYRLHNASMVVYKR